ncbi:ABC transporter permease subunit [Undibacter mobilis]|uniref:ABC transporter permease subunit n=1 Tax=Undibacter mobilis TaxID=2292256 RepID=A0A371BDK9_9BRAD|nr:ABC transporter permease subunit [Undibacter mobilis]RDV05607.1 ABC transporter permease subunit [Undibacter mobilis]
MSMAAGAGKGLRRVILGTTTLWLMAFTLLPVLIVVAVSLSEPRLGQPPFTPLFTQGEGLWPTFNGSIASYLTVVSDSLYIAAFVSSLRIAAGSAFITLLIAYPMAYAIARASDRARLGLLMLVILPFWTSFLIRTYAWTGLLNTNGLINNTLIKLGVISEPLTLLHTEFAVHLGIVYSYLPFMVLPIYAVLERMDWSLIEAAQDLGARPLKTFFRVTLPLSLPGVFAGWLLVFIPALGEFIIPDLLGGPDTLMLGRVLWTEFFNNRDWPVASALAVLLLLIVLLSALLLVKALRRREVAS